MVYFRQLKCYDIRFYLGAGKIILTNGTDNFCCIGCELMQQIL